jgi:hypothetical protein
VSKIGSNRDYYIIDSTPLKVCRLSCSRRVAFVKVTFETSPDKDYCATLRMHYYSYKLHAVCTIDGDFSDFDLTKASVHDIHYLKIIR